MRNVSKSCNFAPEMPITLHILAFFLKWSRLRRGGRGELHIVNLDISKLRTFLLFSQDSATFEGRGRGRGCRSVSGIGIKVLPSTVVQAWSPTLLPIAFRLEFQLSSGGSRGSNKANRNGVRQITKFGIIVFSKIVINISI